MAQIKVKMNKLPQAAANLDGAVSDAIGKFVLDVEALADGETPVDTGHLKNSKHVEINGVHASIHWQAEYALYVHEGTRYQPSKPFAANAVEKAMPSLEAAMNEIEGRLS